MVDKVLIDYTFLEYLGIPGASDACAEAVEYLLHSRRIVRHALILTIEKSGNSSHALFLTDNDNYNVVIKAGFSSGYLGAGPNIFSKSLALLIWHDVEIDEIQIEQDIIKRLDGSALLTSDIETINNSQRIRPKRFWDYIFEFDLPRRISNPWHRREPIIPFAILDERIAVIAKRFWEDADGALIKAHRQLEELVRKKSGTSLEDAQGGPAKTYALIFNKPARLTWHGITASEHAGRTNLFHGVLTAYRHPRAHRTIQDDPEEQLRELLLLNHLFRLEAEAVRTPDDAISLSAPPSSS